jgi:CHAD domain-containing protein
MRDYARLQTAILLRRFAFQVNRTARNTDADSIHDLRTSIRRLSQCLRIFADFYPGNAGKKLRRQMQDLMSTAGSVRDLDIAAELAVKSGVASDTPLIQSLEAERRQSARRLALKARRWNNKDFSRKWRARLEL